MLLECWYDHISTLLSGPDLCTDGHDMCRCSRLGHVPYLHSQNVTCIINDDMYSVCTTHYQAELLKEPQVAT